MSREDKTSRSNLRKSKVVRQNTNRNSNVSNVSKNADWNNTNGNVSQRRRNTSNVLNSSAVSRKVSGLELMTVTNDVTSNTVWGKSRPFSMNSFHPNDLLSSSSMNNIYNTMVSDRTYVSISWLNYILDHMNVLEMNEERRAETSGYSSVEQEYQTNISPQFNLFHSSRTTHESLHSRARLLVLQTWYVNLFCSMPSSQAYLQSLSSKVSFHSIEKVDDVSEKIYFWCALHVSGSTASGLACSNADIDTGIQFISIPESKLYDYLLNSYQNVVHNDKSSQLSLGLEYIPNVWGDFKGTTVPYTVSSHTQMRLGHFLKDPMEHIQKETGIQDHIKARLEYVLSRIQRRHWYQTTVYEHASTPLVKLKFEEAGLEVDICTVDSVSIQIANIQRIIHSLDPRTTPFIVSVKQWAQKQMLNDAYSGSIPSVGWVFLALNFLLYVEPLIGVHVNTRAYLSVCQHEKEEKPSGYTKDTILSCMDDVVTKLLPLEVLLTKFFSHYEKFDFNNYAVHVGAMVDSGAGQFHAETLAQRYECYKQWFQLIQNDSPSNDVEDITMDAVVLERIAENQQWKGCIYCDEIILNTETLFPLRHTCDFIHRKHALTQNIPFTQFSQYQSEAEECLQCHLSRSIPLNNPDLVGLRYICVLKAQKLLAQYKTHTEDLPVHVHPNVFQPLTPIWSNHVNKSRFLSIKKFPTSIPMNSPLIVVNPFVPFTTDTQTKTPMNTPQPSACIHIPRHFLSWVESMEPMHIDTMFQVGVMQNTENLVAYTLVEPTCMKVQQPVNICRVVVDRSCAFIINKLCEGGIALKRTLDTVKLTLHNMIQLSISDTTLLHEEQKDVLVLDQENESANNTHNLDNHVPITQFQMNTNNAPYNYPYALPPLFFHLIKPILYEGFSSIFTSMIPNQPTIEMIIQEAHYRTQTNLTEEVAVTASYKSLLTKLKHIDQCLFHLTCNTKLPLHNALGYIIHADMDPLLTLLAAIGTPIASNTEEEQQQDDQNPENTSTNNIMPNTQYTMSEQMLQLLSTVNYEAQDTEKDKFISLLKLLCPQIQTYTSPHLFK